MLRPVKILLVFFLLRFSATEEIPWIVKLGSSNFSKKIYVQSKNILLWVKSLADIILIMQNWENLKKLCVGSETISFK